MKYLVLFLLLSTSLFGQKAVLLKKADQLFEEKSYTTAIERYEEFLQLDSGNVKVFNNLAIAYRLVNNPEKSIENYKKVNEYQDLNDEQHYFLGQMYLIAGMKNEAIIEITAFGKSSLPNTMVAHKIINNINQIDEYYKDSALVEINKLPFNSDEADFCPLIYNNKLIFTSSRHVHHPIVRKHDWTDQSYYGIYAADIISDSIITYGTPEKYFHKVHSKFNDGPISISPDGQKMFVTRNILYQKSKKEKHYKLQIFTMEKDTLGEFDFSTLRSFEHNITAYNFAHPFITNDGNALFFSSDMPGAIGGMDLFVCFKEGNSWSTPKNLGVKINTLGNELFPVVDSSNYLIFSSNGWGGIGGLDLYESKWDGKYTYELPENLGYPMNSSFDDFGVWVDSSGRKGYMSSNRGNHGLNDDIYSFVSQKSRVKDYQFFLKDSVLSTLISKGKIVITDLKSNKEIIYSISKDSVSSVALVPGNTYRFEISSGNYIAKAFDYKVNSNKIDTFNMDLPFTKNLNVVVYNNNRDQKPVANIPVVVEDEQKEYYRAVTNSSGHVDGIRLNREHNYIVYCIDGNDTTSKVSESTLKLKDNESETHVFYLKLLKDVCLEGTFVEKYSSPSTPVAKVEIKVLDYETKELLNVIYTDSLGKFSYCEMIPNKKYLLHYHKLGYFANHQVVDTKGLRKGATIKQIYDIEKIVLGKAIKLDKIYFDIGKWNIKFEASKELDKVVELMTENPDLVIELSSHTDCRGNANSNFELSDKRAKSSADYIMEKGVDSIRVSGTGYGETKLVNDCACEGVVKSKCSERQHAENRRTEFKVVGYIYEGKVYYDPSFNEEGTQKVE